MALGVGWVRPGAGGIGGTLLLKPDGYLWAYEPYGVTCFEGNEE